MRRLPSKDMDRANDLVMKSPMYRGEPSLPTHHLDDAHLAPHEKEMAAELAKTLSNGFAPEVLTFAAGALLDGDKSVPTLKAPTLVVTYRVEPSGAAFASKNPMGIFIGLGFFIQFELYLPGQAEPLSQKHNFAQSIPTHVITEFKKGEHEETLETQVYRETLHNAFAEARERYLDQWFSEPVKK